MDVIFRRRSIRHYTNEPVTREQIEQLLHAAMAAPSAGNAQPWRFLIITDRAKLDTISKLQPYAEMTVEASAAILVCGESKVEKHPGNWMLDCSAATQNILLMATAIGLGAVWVGIWPRQERLQVFNDLFQLPEGVAPFCLIPLGYPDEFKAPSERYDEAKVHWENWNPTK
ncbi:MAG: nitroreductase family protein [bacterium]|nr:nitroreductase family protein [bacterium]